MSFPARTGWAAWVLLLLTLLPAVPAQTSSSSTSSSASSSASQPSASKAPVIVAPVASSSPKTITHTIGDEGEVALNLTDDTPFAELQFDHDITNLALIFNLVLAANSSSTSAKDALAAPPKVFVFTDQPPATGHGPSPGGHLVSDSLSGGTRAGGFNVRVGSGAWDLAWDHGFANWTHGYSLERGVVAAAPARPVVRIERGLYPVEGGGYDFDPSLVLGSTLYVRVTASESFAAGDVVPQISSHRALVGDSTATTAIIFSPLLYHDPIPQPSFPNYTLPTAQLVLPEWDTLVSSVGPNSSTSEASNFPFGYSKNVKFAVVETSSSPVVALGLESSVTAIASIVTESERNYSAIGGNTTQWMSVGGQEGFRTWLAIGGLKPSTNYTVWAVSEDDKILTLPTWFATKSADFPCSLVAPSDLCPDVAYSVPFSPISDTNPMANISAEVNSTLETNLAAFATSLGASGIACGRDMYSFVSTCLDCYTAYRTWLCHIVLPRCAPAPGSVPPFESTSGSAAPTAAFSVPRTPDEPRNPQDTSPTPAFAYDEMQPCIGLCTAVERKCPNLLGWTCPHRNFNANESYAYIGKDNKKNDGFPDHGYPAQDVWGNRWCSL